MISVFTSDEELAGLGVNWLMGVINLRNNLVMV